jgi:hypothetical protein
LLSSCFFFSAFHPQELEKEAESSNDWRLKSIIYLKLGQLRTLKAAVRELKEYRVSVEQICKDSSKRSAGQDAAARSAEAKTEL